MAQTPLRTDDRVFLDATYAIALASDSDELHWKAIALAAELEASGTRLVTTWAVLLEIGNALSKARYRSAAAQILSALRSDPTIEVVPLSERLLEKALSLFAQRPDKEWGLTDCISFVVMREAGITAALTADEHYRQAG
jgi:hypothetical protein